MSLVRKGGTRLLEEGHQLSHLVPLHQPSHLVPLSLRHFFDHEQVARLNKLIRFCFNDVVIASIFLYQHVL